MDWRDTISRALQHLAPRSLACGTGGYAPREVAGTETRGHGIAVDVPAGCEIHLIEIREFSFVVRLSNEPGKKIQPTLWTYANYKTSIKSGLMVRASDRNRRRASQRNIADIKCVRCRRIFEQIVRTAKQRGTLAGICPDCRNEPPAKFRIVGR